VGETVRRAIAEEADPVTEALLFAADHAAHLDAVVKPALEQGTLVISDRYTDSRYAYQGVTLEGHIPDPLCWLRQVHGSWSVKPDLTILLVLPVEEALSRGSVKAHREHFEEAGTLTRVQANYLSLAAGDPSRFVVVDALQEKEEIQRFVSRVIREYAGQSRSRTRS
jgi:dTMP kinase